MSHTTVQMGLCASCLPKPVSGACDPREVKAVGQGTEQAKRELFQSPLVRTVRLAGASLKALATWNFSPKPNGGPVSAHRSGAHSCKRK